MQNAEAIPSGSKTQHRTCTKKFPVQCLEEGIRYTTHLRIIRGLDIRAHLPGIPMAVRQWTAFPTASVSGVDEVSFSRLKHVSRVHGLINSYFDPTCLDRNIIQPLPTPFCARAWSSQLFPEESSYDYEGIMQHGTSCRVNIRGYNVTSYSSVYGVKFKALCTSPVQSIRPRRMFLVRLGRSRICFSAKVGWWG
jgi:hypothetical protein